MQYFYIIDLVLRSIPKFISQFLELKCVHKHFSNYLFSQIIKRKWKTNLLWLLGRPARTSGPWPLSAGAARGEKDEPGRLEASAHGRGRSSSARERPWLRHARRLWLRQRGGRQRLTVVSGHEWMRRGTHEDRDHKAKTMVLVEGREEERSIEVGMTAGSGEQCWRHRGGYGPSGPHLGENAVL
jgi:hypothetical protein